MLLPLRFGWTRALAYKNYEEWITFSKKLAEVLPKLAEVITVVSRSDNKKLAEVGDTKGIKETIKETIQKKYGNFKNNFGKI